MLQCLCKPWGKPSAQRAHKSVFSFVSATAKACGTQRPRPLPVCQGHTGCGNSRAREVWQPSFWSIFAGFWKKLVCKLSVLLARPSVCLGPGGSGGRLWLFWAAWLFGGAAGGTAAAPAAEKTCFDRFGRLRVGKSSTRMANRCPRIFDAGGKAGDQVGL